MSEIKNITKELEERFDLNSDIEDGYILINEFDGKINGNTYEVYEDLAISICRWITKKYDLDCDYKILEFEDYDMAFEIIN